jgi:autotransporter translocation and assembly factor TamB
MTKWRSWKVVLYATLIFVAGLFIGILTGPLVLRTFLRPPTPAEMSSHILARLQSRLALTPEQTAQIKPFVELTSSDIEAIRLATTKQISDRIAETNSKIAPLLSPEQKTKLDQMETERRERMRHAPPFFRPRLP